MELALLVDIGSTYTKATVFNLTELSLKATVKAFTTIKEGIDQGLKEVFDKLTEQGVELEEIDHKLACSSAAGGLKMVAVGLVPELTAEAAKRAALGAGAKVADVYSYELTADEIEEIIGAEPDVILLAGGTDGGNQDIILENAKRLAESELAAPVIVAGNKVVAKEVEETLVAGRKEVYLTDNVMPKLEELNIEPARQKIREVFLEQIIYAKGLDQVEGYLEGVIMPTPSAVMKAAELIAEGTAHEEGLGELMIVDIGGATTDIHSAAKGQPTKGGVNLRGLEEPYVKRTVEGDLGMRYSASSLMESVGEEEVLSFVEEELKDQLLAYIDKIGVEVDYVPTEQEEKEFDLALAKAATNAAINRHVGRIETVYSPFGQQYVQYGKDLTKLDLIIGTGGVVVHSEKPAEILEEGLFNEEEPQILAPLEPKLMLDQDYILSAIGLLAEIKPKEALQLSKNYLTEV
ncbi:methylaspartate mutase accessory protein GlmL [Natroniella sulfidigena]|uniref:methylaspartate mutase accessory protein GlmL n=1 Tax=Natroniella sulfidigena TaxID=723921 RepID=UPI00200A30B1|nr:methylaspartate mutase accessory protein GlmL [Natroniella sulfidigena]MCK8815819.1 methylaspartate mutase accessory protein GlmL [Natroniella sulfidigena]